MAAQYITKVNRIYLDLSSHQLCDYILYGVFSLGVRLDAPHVRRPKPSSTAEIDVRFCNRSDSFNCDYVLSFYAISTRVK